MAVADHPSGRGLMPWTGVAALLSVGDATPQLGEGSGRAFCFLPLPVRTGLPVHVNGYFELSSNRRDVWYVFHLSVFPTYIRGQEFLLGNGRPRHHNTTRDAPTQSERVCVREKTAHAPGGV